MYLCNFCAAGAIESKALERHWKRGMRTCEGCEEYKSCQDVDETDPTIWLVHHLVLSRRRKRARIVKGED